MRAVRGLTYMRGLPAILAHDEVGTDLPQMAWAGGQPAGLGDYDPTGLPGGASASWQC